MVYDANGTLVDELDYFKEQLAYYNIEKTGVKEVPIQAEKILTPDVSRMSKIEQIHQALILGIRDYFKKSGFSKAILGLSGGIDSALVCVLACEALGAKNVMAVLLPSAFSSSLSLLPPPLLSLHPYRQLRTAESTPPSVYQSLPPFSQSLSLFSRSL